MSRIYLAAILCLVLTLIGCGVAGAGTPEEPSAPAGSPESASTQPGQAAAWDPCAAPGAEPFARLTTSGGIAGVSETLAVHCNGTVERNGEIVANDATLVPPLVTALSASGVLSLPEQEFRPDGQCNDCFNYQLELASGGKPHRWSAVDSAMPEQMGAAIEALRTVDARQ